MTNYELMMELTHDGDCDRCMYGLMGECHLQCTHIDEPDEEIEEQKIFKEETKNVCE